MGELMFGTLVLLVCVWSCCNGAGLQFKGDFTIHGMFPLHNAVQTTSATPCMATCREGTDNKHGFHLVQALRYAVEEINSGAGNEQLLPGITLGYQMYDICSLSASVLATVDLLAQQYNRVKVEPQAVALIGPDSSDFAFTPASALGTYLLPEISYEASNEVLSNKLKYPSFFRTIPSDKNQVDAMIQILLKFNWTWIALLGSDNSYGQQGMLSLSQQASDNGICIAYQAVIPTLNSGTQQRMRDMVRNIIKTKVNTIVVFSSKRIAKGFFPFVIERNVTGKVWIGTEDWSMATLVSAIPGISTIGTVLGVSVKYMPFGGFREFETQAISKLRDLNSSEIDMVVPCLQNTDLYTMAAKAYSLENYDITSSFNVYKAVYAVAHALRGALGCMSGGCLKNKVQPWQLFQQLKRVRFPLRNTTVYFDENGDPPTGYDIVTWTWKSKVWAFRVVGSYSPDPPAFQVDPAQIQWTGEVSDVTMVTVSQCSPECPYGHRELQVGQHKCCFECMACPASTFLNKSGSTSCQPCKQDQWSPAESEECLNRTVLYLPWNSPISYALLVLLTLTLLLTVGTAFLFLINLSTPVVKSAGGRTCLLMLLSMTAASCSTLCHFGVPTRIACLLKQSLFLLSFTICLACVTVRSLQVVCIFKWSSKLPRFYDTWAKNRGPEFFILITSAVEFLISVLHVVLFTPYPSQNYDLYQDSIVLECSNTLSPGSFVEILYVSLLTIACFCLSYMGKDLPANYNEAKCITFSIMIYMISWISFFTVYTINRGTLTMALEVVAVLCSVLGILSGYFLPKVYIIVLKPRMNTTAHFQNCIQMYTMAKQ
ncbi:taste receptor type 1 member 1 [Astyanax mexicanus]|uniref:Taste receptor, type 1, member 1 n=1 Tax=Astyanax mexicanus TaxID=7994 RepID=W5LRG7_ASTMX|nr:taste receptor type 1 member 1 [Astyanax mexicanus]